MIDSNILLLLFRPIPPNIVDIIYGWTLDVYKTQQKQINLKGQPTAFKSTCLFFTVWKIDCHLSHIIDYDFANIDLVPLFCSASNQHEPSTCLQ